MKTEHGLSIDACRVGDEIRRRGVRKGQQGTKRRASRKRRAGSSSVSGFAVMLRTLYWWPCGRSWRSAILLLSSPGCTRHVRACSPPAARCSNTTTNAHGTRPAQDALLGTRIFSSAVTQLPGASLLPKPNETYNGTVLGTISCPQQTLHQLHASGLCTYASAVCSSVFVATQSATVKDLVDNAPRVRQSCRGLSRLLLRSRSICCLPGD